MRRLGGLGMLLLAGVAGCGRPPANEAPWEAFAATAALSTNTVLIGEPVDLRVTVDHPAGVAVRLPVLGGEGSALLVHEQAPAVADLGDGRSRTVADYRIASFEIGDHVISTNQLVFLQEGAEIRSNAFPFVSLQVGSVLTNEEAFAGDKDLARWPPGLPRLLVGILAVAAGAFLAAGLVAWWLFRRGSRGARLPPPPPAHLAALEAIEQLKRKGYIEQERREPFYVELSGIVRRYIEQQFGIDAPDQTTEEFMLIALRSRRLTGAQRDLIGQFLAQCDLVKFARAQPAADDMRAALAAAEQLVRETGFGQEAVAA